MNKFLFPAVLILTVFSGYCVWRLGSDRALVSLCVIFIASSLLLFGQLAPLAMFHTTTGSRAIQGLRVLFAFTVINIGLLSVVMLAALAGWRQWLMVPSNESDDPDLE